MDGLYDLTKILGKYDESWAAILYTPESKCYCNEWGLLLSRPAEAYNKPIQ